MKAKFGISVLLLVVNCCWSAPLTLRQVNLVYRHGDRSPIEIFPTDPNINYTWPQGIPGWLTNIGMNQHFELGQWLQKRYNGFISSEYKASEIQIQSSDENRCLMSAYSNLAGMYPPKEGQIWNTNITWQPIPVHTQPEEEDNILVMGKPCPKYDQLLDEALKSHKISEEEKKNKDFYAYIGKKTGWDHNNITNIWRIADSLFCEKTHNLTLPDWTNNRTVENITVYEKLRLLESYQFTLLFGDNRSLYKGGPLLGLMLDNMRKMQNKTIDTKFFMYSGHDTTVSALLSALNIFNKKSPPYAATVILELHEDPPKNYYVNILYKNSTDSFTTDSYTNMVLPNCTMNCSFEMVVEQTKHRVPGNWDEECALPSGDPTTETWKFSPAWMVATVVSCLLCVVVGIFIVFAVKKRERRAFLYGKFDTTQ
ncbi:hypothetical protein CHS0354_017360 [Potamilus streckersoni]|uniref:acid phosphatase n=1 Tax=Potamilus streckersoni TaxID=2493646 RepID=A0AAE0W691_9BIVA|nr:hypothetical protein CHS0354_017360 [Potamilus streckersoni]